MFRYKSNKQAFIIAALLVFLCLVCLTGATLALFTNDPNDGTIGIVTTAGNVKIDVVDTSGVTLQNRSLAFITPAGYVESEHSIFEPGASFYTQNFIVTNEGSVPVNFKVAINHGEGEKVKKFVDSFDVWIVEKDENDPENSTIKLLSEFDGTLGVGEKSSNLQLYIKMKETAGNEFSNEHYSGIGITVTAVQGNVPID